MFNRIELQVKANPTAHNPGKPLIFEVARETFEECIISVYRKKLLDILKSQHSRILPGIAFADNKSSVVISNYII